MCGRAVNTSNSRFGGPGCRPRPSLCSLRQGTFSTLSLFINVYNWVPATYCWGVTLRRISIPSRGGGGVAILQDMPHAKETGISSVRMGLWFLSYLTLFTLLFSTVPHVTDFSLGTATFSIYFIIFYLFIYLFIFYYFIIYFLTSS